MRGQEIGIWTNYVESIKLHLGPCWGFVLAISGSLGPRAEAEFSLVSQSCATLRMRWPKYWRFSLIISPSNEHPGLISFSMDWLDLLAVQGTLKSLLQHHSSKALILLHSAFFIVQLSHPYMTTGKTIALTRRTFVGKVMSLYWNKSYQKREILYVFCLYVISKE